MPERITTTQSMDRATSASICRAIGERLTQNLGPEAPMPSRFERLIEEMRRQEMGNRETDKPSRR